MMRVILGMLLVICCSVSAAAQGGVPFPPEGGGASYLALGLEEGIDRLSSSLAREIALRYFHADRKPTIRVAVFDFTDTEGNVTVGSRYVSNRIRIAFGKSPQLILLIPPSPSETEPPVTGELFEKDDPLKARILGELRADVYVMGRIDPSDGTAVTCRVDLWGVKPPFDDFSQVSQLGELILREDPTAVDVVSPLPWRAGFTPSGLAFFTHVLVSKASKTEEADTSKVGEVIFLSQPMCDDLNLSWQVKADGMVYDVRKESEAGTLKGRTGQIMQSRVKGLESLKELSYIIKNVGLVIKESNGSATPLEFYILPKTSDFYLIPYQQGETGLRFMYLWAKRGLSRNPSPHESGKGWKLYVAEQDYRNVMPLGTHMATATLEPIAETEYGTKQPRSEYVSRFKFDVLPGLNIYVINYVFRRDRPEIFVRRLQIEGSRDELRREVKRITEVYQVYGE